MAYQAGKLETDNWLGYAITKYLLPLHEFSARIFYGDQTAAVSLRDTNASPTAHEMALFGILCTLVSFILAVAVASIVFAGFVIGRFVSKLLVRVTDAGSACFARILGTN